MEKIILSEKGLPKHIQVKRDFRDDDTAFIEAIPGIVFAVVISYIYLNIGTFMNGALGSELVDTFPNNVATGSLSSDNWHNSTSNSTRTITISGGTAGQLHLTNSKFYILANGTHTIYYNLTVNGNNVNVTSQLTAYEGFNWTLSALISAGAVAGSDTSITFLFDVNSTQSQIHIVVTGTYYLASNWRDDIENNTVDTMGTVSEHFDSNVNIIKIAITISVLLVPIMTIMTLRRYT